jgi:predicted extracellular nuclease
MTRTTSVRRRLASYLPAPAVLVCALVAISAPSAWAQAPLTTAGTPYTQNFDTLANTGTSSTTPVGWVFAETGTNANTLYNTGTGSSNTGDTYSFGAATSSERALGGLQSGSLVPTIGASFVNQTGTTVTRLGISYTGEHWRLGTAGRTDRLDFQYSTTATSLADGAWAHVDALDFSSPTTGGTVGLRDGNAAANRTTVSFTIVGLQVAPGATVWIRWTDFNASGADDGLAVDDFSITPNPFNPSGVGTATPNDVFANDLVLLAVTASAGASPIASVVGDLSAIGGASTQSFVDDGTGGDVAPGDGVYSVQAVVSPGTSLGLKSLPFTVTDTAARTGTGSIALQVSAVPTCTPDHTIAEIQGNGPASSIVGLPIVTRGIVYAVRSNGFYVQMESGDGDPATSDGIFVFTNNAPPAAATAGNLVCVSGTVAEFIPSTPQLPLTEIAGSVVVTRLASNQPLPTPVAITAAMTTGPDAVAQLEAREGMRVTVASLTVVGPSLGNVDENDATATNNGIFHGVVAGVARPFREAGIDFSDPLPICDAGANCAIPVFDSNLERLRIVSTLLQQPALDVSAGTVITGLTGPLDYGFRTYTIGPESTTAIGVSGGATVIPVPAQRAAEVTVASINLQRFFDDVQDPDVDEVVLTTNAYQKRLAKASLVVRDVLRSPDVLGLVEVENQSTLDALAARINADTIAANLPNPQYVGYLEEGNDIGGIDVAFLVKSSRIEVAAVTQYGKATTFINPDTGEPNILNDRPPLVLDAVALKPNGDPFPFTVIANHLRSLNDVETPRVQAKRRAQAEFLADLVQEFQEINPDKRILLVGDFNAFDVNDGYVDGLGTIAGVPAPPEQVAAASDDLVDPNLSNLNLLLPPSQRYSYVFDGNAQTLDHALANAALMPWVSRFAYGRSNADFPQSLYGSTDARRLTDHDGSVAYIDLGTPSITARILDAETSPTGETWVDIEVSNSGDGFADQLAITEIRFSALKASPPLVLSDPIIVGSLQPGEVTVVRVSVTLPAGSNFNVFGQGQYRTQTGEMRLFLIKPETFNQRPTAP